MRNRNDVPNHLEGPTEWIGASIEDLSLREAEFLYNVMRVLEQDDPNGTAARIVDAARQGLTHQMIEDWEGRRQRRNAGFDNHERPEMGKPANRSVGRGFKRRAEQ